MATDFQIVFDKAQTISINKKRKVAQTVSRDGTVKATSLGGQVWEFEVKLPDGPKWTDYRGLIERMEALDRVTTSTVQINKAAHSWMTGYQGNLANVNAIQVTNTNTAFSNQLTITTGTNGLISGQFKFKSGDFIQLGSTGSVYSVVYDVPHNGNTITVHRPIIESSSTYNLIVGQSVSWNVICVSFPQWSIVNRNQISWSGPFKFVEAK